VLCVNTCAEKSSSDDSPIHTVTYAVVPRYSSSSLSTMRSEGHCRLSLRLTCSGLLNSVTWLFSCRISRLWYMVEYFFIFSVTNGIWWGSKHNMGHWLWSAVSLIGIVEVLSCSMVLPWIWRWYFLRNVGSDRTTRHYIPETETFISFTNVSSSALNVLQHFVIFTEWISHCERYINFALEIILYGCVCLGLLSYMHNL
jgi:hypothetical protein